MHTTIRFTIIAFYLRTNVIKLSEKYIFWIKFQAKIYFVILLTLYNACSNGPIINAQRSQTDIPSIFWPPTIKK